MRILIAATAALVLASTAYARPAGEQVRVRGPHRRPRPEPRTDRNILDRRLLRAVTDACGRASAADLVGPEPPRPVRGRRAARRT
jgi:hypothetical protein